MLKNVHGWIDDWFLSLSENPDKLDKAIKKYEAARMTGVICFVIVLAMYLLTVFKSTNPADYGFMFSLVVFMMVLNIQIDLFTKILKLQRQQQKRDTKDAKSPSGIGKKSPLSEIALIYGSVLVTGIIGILVYMFYVMDT